MIRRPASRSVDDGGIVEQRVLACLSGYPARHVSPLEAGEHPEDIPSADEIVPDRVDIVEVEEMVRGFAGPTGQAVLRPARQRARRTRPTSSSGPSHPELTMSDDGPEAVLGVADPVMDEAGALAELGEEGVGVASHSFF